MDVQLNIFDATMRLGRSRDHILGAPVSAEGLLQVMDNVGIAHGLVWHADAQHYDTHKGNQQLIVEIAEHSRLHPCWILMPHETGEVPHPTAIVNSMIKTGVKAARVFPRDHLFKFRIWNIKPILESLTAVHIPLFVDFGVKGWSDEYYDWEGLLEIGVTYPDLPIIITNVNISSNRRLIPLMQQIPNLFVETSYYTVHRGIELLVSTVGPERIVFGSGLPNRAPGPALSALTYSNISEKHKQLIASGNLKRLLQLDGENF
jgi:predicted TIM-barrel fold metal-dependent hydrolase